MIQFFQRLMQFVKNVAEDQRIPARDKTVLVALVALIISPVDIIPDWIPIIGVLDDLMMLALVLDYFFEYLDQEILLSHYPWGLKSFVRLRWWARWIARLAPGALKRRIWKYKPDPYGRLRS